MRELPSASEAEGEKDYPSVTCGDSSPDKGSQERGETYLCSNSSQIVPINESLLSVIISSLIRTYSASLGSL